MQRKQGRMRKGQAPEQLVRSGRGIRPCRKPGCCLSSRQLQSGRAGARQPPSPCRSLGALLLGRPSPAKLPDPAKAFAGLRQKYAEPPSRA